MSGDSPEFGDATQSSGQAARPSLSKDVFVSYASQDAAVANSVVEALESQGIRCWIAPRDVTPGEFYADAIVHALPASLEYFLNTSQWLAASQGEPSRNRDHQSLRDAPGMGAPFSSLVGCAVAVVAAAFLRDSACLAQGLRDSRYVATARICS
jgi:TIR domain